MGWSDDDDRDGEGAGDDDGLFLHVLTVMRGLRASGLEWSAPPIPGFARKQLRMIRMQKMRRAHADWPRRRAEAWPCQCWSMLMRASEEEFVSAIAEHLHKTKLGEAFWRVCCWRLWFRLAETGRRSLGTVPVAWQGESGAGYACFVLLSLKLCVDQRGIGYEYLWEEVLIVGC